MSNIWQGASRGGLFTQTKGLSLFEVRRTPLLDFFTLQEMHQFARENSNLIFLITIQKCIVESFKVWSLMLKNLAITFASPSATLTFHEISSVLKLNGQK